MVLIKGLQKTSVVDYPGKVSCVIFTAGCNFRCPFCHNAGLIEKKGYDKINTIEENEFFDLLDRRKKWIDGVVITGGEPTIHKDLPQLAGKIKNKGFLLKIDTNGTDPDMLKHLVNEGLVDFIAMDVKADTDNYSRASGVKADMDSIKESIMIIRDSGIDHEFRTTMVPGIHAEENIRKMGEMLKGSKRIALQQFDNRSTYDKSYAGVKPFTKEEMITFHDMLKDYADNVEIRAD
ncbi:anaerobic ribonucleoside-triphosphate reductase activating protein [Candidatus Woesearchaeota archaeon]|nr:anaerobic ribonucleoside-triphosphate reductase activating protein [Candidatus Woesearchaeota archaeon]